MNTDIATAVEKLEQVLSEALMNEWEAQGHAMTSKVVKEIEYKTKQETNRIILSGYMYPYGSIIAAGTKPYKIPFGGKGRGGTSAYIEALKMYVKNRMNISDEKRALSIAFAIAKTQKEEGMPTMNSYKYSSSGKRLDWIQEAFKHGEDKITEAVSQMAYGLLSVNLDVLLNKWNILLNKE